MQHQLFLPPSTGQHVLQLTQRYISAVQIDGGRSTTLQSTGVCEWNNVAQTYRQTSTGPGAVCLFISLIFRSAFFFNIYIFLHTFWRIWFLVNKTAIINTENILIAKIMNMEK